MLMVRNEEEVLPGCLDSLAGVADALVALDTGSDDATPELLARESRAGRFATVRVLRGELTDFGTARRRLLELVDDGWVLWLDADERLTPALREELLAWKRRPDEDGVWGWRLPFAVEVLGRRMRCRELRGQRHLRLFRREGARFDGAAVHEAVVPPPGAAVADLRAPVLHLTCRSVRHYLGKIARYTTLEAETRPPRPVPWRLGHLLVTGPTTFWRLYVWRGCWRDGRAGLAWAALTAWGAVRRDLVTLGLYGSDATASTRIRS